MNRVFSVILVLGTLLLGGCTSAIRTTAPASDSYAEVHMAHKDNGQPIVQIGRVKTETGFQDVWLYGKDAEIIYLLPGKYSIEANCWRGRGQKDASGHELTWAFTDSAPEAPLEVREPGRYYLDCAPTEESPGFFLKPY